MIIVQVKLKNGDSYAAPIAATLEDAEKFILAQKFIKLSYNDAIIFINVEEIVSIALQEPQIATEQIIDEQEVIDE